MTGDRPREIEERVARATGGGWLALGKRHFKPEHMSREGFSLHAVIVQHPFGPWDAIFTKTEADQDFVAHAREDIPYLLNALQHMEDAYAGAESARQELEFALRKAREVLHATAEAITSVYPTIAGRVIGLEQARETVAHEYWASVAKTLYDAGQKARAALEGKS